MDNIASFLEMARGFIANAASVTSANMSLDLVIKLVLAYFFIIWGAFIIWVIKDITNRTANIFVQALSIFIILFFTPLFGLPIYLLIRPRQTIFEQYYEEGEFDEEDSEHLHHCGGCGYPVEPDFHYCPKCRSELIRECHACHKTMRSDWLACPYCGAENTPAEAIESDEESPKKVKISKKRVEAETTEAIDPIEESIKSQES